MPGAGFKKVAAKFLQTNLDQTNIPFEFVKKELVRFIFVCNLQNFLIDDYQREKTALPSFTATVLQNERITPQELYALKFCAVSLYGGGLDTVRFIFILLILD